MSQNETEAESGDPLWSSSTEDLLDALGWEGQVGQMAQIDINILLNEDNTTLRQDLLDHYIGTLGVGSVLNNMAEQDPVWSILDFRREAIRIQETAEKHGRPPVVWGLDSVHGANYLRDAIVTPQPLNLAASFNTSLAYRAGALASRDTRRAGIPWLFSPLLGLAWNPFWSRIYETFGEDPELVGAMALAMTRGIQATDDNDDKGGLVPSRAAACGKHFVGYSLPRDGHDRAPSWIPTRHLYQYFVLPWKKAVAELDTVMESYTETDGVPNVSNRAALQRLLRKELGFDGVLVTDYAEIYNLAEWHHVARDRREAVRQSLEEGSVDMSMIPKETDEFFGALEDLHGSDPAAWEARVRESARRVLDLKRKLNLFEEGFGMTLDAAEGPGHSPEDLAEALDMTRQSIVLAKNEGGLLPLRSDDFLRVLVTGPAASNLSFLTGGWTWQWQGADSNQEDAWFTYGSTMVEALRAEGNWQVSYACGVDVLGGDCDPGEDFRVADATPPGTAEGVVEKIKGWVGWQDAEPTKSIEKAMSEAANNQDVVVVCLGEENYTEKPGDIRDLELPRGQYELVAGLREAAGDSTRIVLVYFGGRPRLLAEIEPLVDAVFLGFLPGPLAAEAMADLLTGRTNPSAKLPITYPKHSDGGGIPYLHSVSDQCTEDTGGVLPHWDNAPCEVQWPFGHGLSYSEFEYENLTLSTTELVVRRDQENPDLSVTFRINNPSSTSGAIPAMLFTFDEFRSTTPEYKRLRAFEKVWVEANSSRDVTLSIPMEDLRFVGHHDETHYVFQDGMEFVVGLGPEVDCRLSPKDPRCSQKIRITTDPDYVGACEAACGLWSESDCGEHFGFSSSDCWEECSSIHFEENLEMNNDGWGWNYVHCMESIVWADSFRHEADCWKLTTFCRNVLATPAMDELGGGITPPSFVDAGNGPLVLVLALLSGILASLMVGVSMRGGCRRKDDPYGDVQFSAVHTHELMT